MTLNAYMRALRKFWWLIVVGALLGLGAAMGLTLRATPLYRSSVTLIVSTPISSQSPSAVQLDQYAQQRVNTYVSLLTSDELANRILRKTGLLMSPHDVAAEISGAAELNTVLLTATVTDPSFDRSMAISGAIASEFPKMIDSLDNPGNGQGPLVKLNVTSGPDGNPAPVSPRKTLNLALGLIAGLILGIAAALIRELTDTSVRSVAVLRTLTSRPVLGAIAFDRTARRSPLVTGNYVHSLRAEALRTIRTNLQFVDVDRSAQVLVVTSSLPEEGKSATAANLAIVFAETGRSVLLIEADLRRPRVADYLGLERSAGLTNVLAGQVELDDVLQPWGLGRVTFLGSGSIPPNPSELLGSANMTALLAMVRTRFDLVLLDTPPLLPVTDAAVAAAHADGAVVIVRHGRTSRNQILAALNSLEAVDARIVGTILNMSPTGGPSKKYGYEGYGTADSDPIPVLEGPPTDSAKAGGPNTEQSLSNSIDTEARNADRSAVNNGSGLTHDISTPPAAAVPAIVTRAGTTVDDEAQPRGGASHPDPRAGPNS